MQRGLQIKAFSHRVSIVIGWQNRSASDSIRLVIHVCNQETEPNDALCRLTIIFRLFGLYFYDGLDYHFLTDSQNKLIVDFIYKKRHPTDWKPSFLRRWSISDTWQSQAFAFGNIYAMSILWGSWFSSKLRYTPKGVKVSHPLFHAVASLLTLSFDICGEDLMSLRFSPPEGVSLWE